MPKANKRQVLGLKLSIIVLILFLCGAIFVVSGCRPQREDREFEIDGWTLFQFGNTGNVHIVALHDESIVIDGVLTIPTQIGGYTIYSFGAIYGLWVTGCEATKIVVPPEIRVNAAFWMMQGGPEGERVRPHMPPLTSVKYVKLMCGSFDNISDILGASRFVLIIPNGSSPVFEYKFITVNTPEGRYTIIEKEQWQQAKI